MSSYTDFALFYDMFTRDVDYEKRTDYLCEIFRKYSKTPTLLLDMACGTGSFSVEFAKRGISVIGVDMSEDMLSVAKEKSEKQNLDILYLCQKAEELELYGTVDGAVCCLDSINHITNYNELVRSFKKISLFLEKDCLFVFDVNTEYKQKNILGNNTFILEEDNVFCAWDNFYDRTKKYTYVNMDFFVKRKDGCYDRFSESICERVYSYFQLSRALSTAGFKIEKVFRENTLRKPTDKCQRAVYVTRKV